MPDLVLKLTFQMKRNLSAGVLSLFLLQGVFCLGQADFPIVLNWPTDNQPTLKFSLAKYQPSGVVNGQGIYVSDVTVQNVSEQPVPKSIFTVFVMDKDGVRIGRGLLRLPDIAAKHTEKSQLQFSVAGTPVGLKLLSGRTIPLKVVSMPDGANLRVDGQESGMTPKVVDFTIGSHVIELSKQGYAPANSPLEVSADELPGGSISFELGGLSKDMVEFRDGRTVLGDVLAQSTTMITVRVAGKDQKYDRNQVRKMILVEREVTPQPPVTQTAPAKPTQ
jgi:PEGA domain